MNLFCMTLCVAKLNEWDDSEFGVSCRKKSGEKEGWTRESVVLILSDRLDENVTQWIEVSSRLIWVKVKFGVERWASVYNVVVLEDLNV